MKKTILLFLLAVALMLPARLLANTAPTVVIQSATMRPGTTLMDVVFRVNDPDDATVKTRALAFVDGTRSFAKVIKPVTFAEGTGSKIGDAIATNTNHTITWDVAADWNVQLGQIKFEILAMDGRGLLPFEWITIPAAGGNPAVTVSKNSLDSTQKMNALFWLYASGDSGMTFANGQLTASMNDPEFFGRMLAAGEWSATDATPFILKRMNLDTADDIEIVIANNARSSLSSSSGNAANRPYPEITPILGWGSSSVIPSNKMDVMTAIAAGGSHSLALKSDGTVVAWGNNNYSQTTVPSGLSGVTAIAAGGSHSLALKSDGTIVAWGDNSSGQTTVPSGLSGVTAIAAGGSHSLALKSDGMIVAWGNNNYGKTTVPSGLSGVTAIAAGNLHNLALKSDGTVVAWGNNNHGQTTVPSGLSGVTAIAAGGSHSLALKSDGTLVAWGDNSSGETTVPSGLSGVTAIAAGYFHSLALKSDGTVVAWFVRSYNDYGQTTFPSGLSGVTAIAAGERHSLALKSDTP